jgi:hypothetical protein
MNTIDDVYRRLCTTPSDIYEHLPTLREYASKCAVVAEMGVRTPTSTWALLRGLCDSTAAPPKKLFCVDIAHVNMEQERQIAARAGIHLTFICENSVAVDFDTPVDLLFIDTWHVYGHLKRELAAHHNRVNKYIIMHDTTVDAYEGESIRCHMDIEEQMRVSGYTRDEICSGLWPAVKEFVATHAAEWKIEARYSNCNGLTVLSRLDQNPQH